MTSEPWYTMRARLFFSLIYNVLYTQAIPYRSTFNMYHVIFLGRKMGNNNRIDVETS